MTQFRTSSLFHYTNYNALKKILSEGIIPNFCKEDLSYVKIPQMNFVIGIPMVSFCDIPLTRTNEFRSRYGNHAIGLNKQWGIDKGVNPVFYIHNKKILYFLHHTKDETESFARNIGGHRIYIPQLDPTFVTNPLTLEAKHYQNLNLYGFAKKYTGVNPKTGIEQCNYEENEWRYIVQEGVEIPWFWNQNEYDTWRGTSTKPEASDRLKSQKLTFTVEDISHIIVEKDHQIPAIITFIRKLTVLGGMGNTLTAEEKDMLCAKVTSIERIDKDY